MKGKRRDALLWPMRTWDSRWNSRLSRTPRGHRQPSGQRCSGVCLRPARGAAVASCLLVQLSMGSAPQPAPAEPGDPRPLQKPTFPTDTSLATSSSCPLGGKQRGKTRCVWPPRPQIRFRLRVERGPPDGRLLIPSSGSGQRPDLGLTLLRCRRARPGGRAPLLPSDCGPLHRTFAASL